MAIGTVIKSKVKEYLRNRGIYILRYIPRGVSFSEDVKTLNSANFQVIFDVGANIGQSSCLFLKEFPQAKIWSFEPSHENFRKMAARLSEECRVVCENVALSSSEGSMSLAHTDDETRFHLVHEPTISDSNKEFETVSVTTVDSYCSAKGIAHIDFLKIDTEGHDLDVLFGSENMIRNDKISFIQCECSASPDNKFHVSLEEIKSYLEARGYRLFAMYEQCEEFMIKAPNLRRVNAVFVSSQTIANNTVAVCI